MALAEGLNRHFKGHSAAPVLGLFGDGRPAIFRAPKKNPTDSMRSVLTIILIILDIYIWLLIASAILSWLIAFNVVNARNQFVHMVGDFLWKITEPVLRKIAREPRWDRQRAIFESLLLRK